MNTTANEKKTMELSPQDLALLGGGALGYIREIEAREAKRLLGGQGGDIRSRLGVGPDADGDEVRKNLSKGLGFSKEDRDTNIERIGWVASRLTRQGGAIIAAAISPYEETRQKARQMVEEWGSFVEVHVAASVDECARRDVKGLYEKALAGEIKEFTGISDPYDVP